MARVVVLGSSGFDLTIALDRLPRPGETLLGGNLHTGPGGKGANAAIAARRAGADVTFLTAFGDDDFGKIAAENLRREGIDLTFARVVAGSANQVALIFVGGDGQNLIGVAPGASDRLRPEDVGSLPESLFEPGEGVLLACLEVPIETVEAGLRRARAAGWTTILNPAPAHRGLLDGDFLKLVSILTPNQEEAGILTGITPESPAEAERSTAILRSAGAEGVIITLGPAGAFLSQDGVGLLVGSPRVEVRDTVGAGDAFNGALASAISEGRSLAEAVESACAAGALAVTKPGAQGALPTRSEIERILGTS